jgi:hypothetical protein
MSIQFGGCNNKEEVNQEERQNEELNSGVITFSGEHHDGADFFGIWLIKSYLQKSSANDAEQLLSKIIISKTAVESASFSTSKPVFEENNYSEEQLKDLGLTDDNILHLFRPPTLGYKIVLTVTDDISKKQCKFVEDDIDTLYYFSSSGNVFILERLD